MRRITSRVPVRLEVLQQDASGYRLAWTFGETVIEENTLGPTESWPLTLFDGLRMVLRTDASGRLKSVANARDVKEFLVAARRRLQEQLPGLGVSEEERVILTRMLHLLTNPEISVNLVLPDAQFLLLICGQSLELGKRQSAQLGPAETPGAKVSFVLRAIDRAANRATVEWRNEESPAGREFLDALLRAAAELQGAPSPGSLQIDDGGVIEFDLGSGWPARVKHERKVRFGKTNRQALSEIEWIPPTPDPT